MAVLSFLGQEVGDRDLIIGDRVRMAHFPQGLAQIDQRCNAGERRVLHQLNRCLGEEFMVWFDIPVGPKARQPDFVVLSPRHGLIVLEVKDWRSKIIKSATRDRVELMTDRGASSAANPIRQARDYMMEVVGLMQNDSELIRRDGDFKGRLIFPYGWGAVFSGIQRKHVSDDFWKIFPESQVMLVDDLDESVGSDLFLAKLLGMFTSRFACALTLAQRDRVRWHLFPEIRLHGMQLSIFNTESQEKESGKEIEELPGSLQVMDLKQEQVARSIGEGHRLIHGVAGSGKTMILLFRAQHLAAAASLERPVLILCFNRALANYIGAVMKNRGVDDRVQVKTFHAWCDDMVSRYRLSKPVGEDDYFDRLVEVVERAVKEGAVPLGQYAAVLVDEAHDFQESWLAMLPKLVDPTSNSLLVLYDDAQSIYQKRRKQFSFAGVGIKAVGRTSILRFNYRNTSEVLGLAAKCAASMLSHKGDEKSDVVAVNPFSSGRHGPEPDLIVTGGIKQEFEAVINKIVDQIGRGVPLSDIAVLFRIKRLMGDFADRLEQRDIRVQSMGSKSFKNFDWSVQCVRLVTLHSAKGLEFPYVYIVGLNRMPFRDEPLDEEVRLLYVGMTRATHSLVLSAHGSSTVVELVRDALEDRRKLG